MLSCTCPWVLKQFSQETEKWKQHKKSHRDYEARDRSEGEKWRGESRRANSSRINKEMREENNQGNKGEGEMKVLPTDRKVQDGKQEWYGKDFSSHKHFLPSSTPHLFKGHGASKAPVWLELRVADSCLSDCTWSCKVGRRRVGGGQPRGKSQMEKMKTWSENGDQEEPREKGEGREKRAEQCGNGEEGGGRRVWKEEEQRRGAGMGWKEKQQPIETRGLFSLIPPPSVDLHLSHIHPVNGLVSMTDFLHIVSGNEHDIIRL